MTAVLPYCVRPREGAMKFMTYGHIGDPRAFAWNPNRDETQLINQLHWIIKAVTDHTYFNVDALEVRNATVKDLDDPRGIVAVIQVKSTAFRTADGHPFIHPLPAIVQGIQDAIHKYEGHDV